MKDESYTTPGPNDPLGLMKTRDFTKLQQSALPGFDKKRKDEIKAMYARLSGPEQKMLRSLRARRAMDSVDIFHVALREEWHRMTARERELWTDISKITTKLQAKLQGLAKFD